MSRLPDLSRLSRAAALAGVGSLILADLVSDDGFTLGLRYLKRAVLDEGLLGTRYAGGEAGGPIAVLFFAVAIAAALAAYGQSLARVGAGTRLAAAIGRRPDAAISLRDRIRRAAAILVERRRPAADRASEAIDALLTPIAGEGVRVIRPEPVRPVVARPWQVRAAQRTNVTGNTDRWAAPRTDDEEERD